MDNIWVTCCSLHNMLLDNDVNGHEYIQEALQAQKQTAIEVMESSDIDITKVNEHDFPEDPTYPNGCDMVPVNKLTPEDFRMRLIKHFIICKEYKSTTIWHPHAEN